MTDDPHDAIYDILIRECGAIEHNRARFRALELVPGARIRFGGQLGLDGHFVVQSDGSWNVEYSDYDHSPKRARMAHAAAEALHALQGR